MPAYASTQNLVELKDIRDGIVYLKNGDLRQLLIVSGVNFDLKSNEEQELILGAFQNFLNALDFPVQFFIHSRRVDVDEYLKKMESFKQTETNELLKIQIDEYISFIRSFVKENAIINKSFFVIVPYNPLNVPKAAGGLLGIFKKRKQAERPETGVQEQLEQLNLRVAKVTSGLEQIGLRVAPLDNEALIELFYNLYNPSLVEKKNMEIAK